MLMSLRRSASLIAAVSITVAITPAIKAQPKYDPGVTDAEIKIGNVQAYSGPASAYSVIGRTEEAYFRMINEQGGINGRKIKFISYDDSYSPAKTVEQVRKLIESDEVLFIFNGFGTPTQSAVQKYHNAKKVPQLFIASGASKWNDPKVFPWSMGYAPSYRAEGRTFAKFILSERPEAKVAVFYQNDDSGKDYLAGLKDIFGRDSSDRIIAEESYDNSEPTIDSHIVKLKQTGADVLVNISQAKVAAQTIRKMAEIGWKPMHLITNVSTSVGAVMEPAGLEASEGVISARYLMDASEGQWKSNQGMTRFKAFIQKYMPGANLADNNLVYAYSVSQLMVQVLTQCGDTLTRANLMKEAANIKNFVPDVMIPGVKITTSPSDFAPIEQLKMMRFTKGKWETFGEVISTNGGG